MRSPIHPVAQLRQALIVFKQRPIQLKETLEILLQQIGRHESYAALEEAIQLEPEASARRAYFLFLWAGVVGPAATMEEAVKV